MRWIALTTVAAASASLAAVPEAQETSSSGYRCTIDSLRNVSTLDPVPIEEKERYFPSSDLETLNERLILHEATVTATTESQSTHRIDPLEGIYSATTMLTDHSLGEQYEIEATGTCERIGADSAQRRHPAAAAAQ